MHLHLGWIPVLLALGFVLGSLVTGRRAMRQTILGGERLSEAARTVLRVLATLDATPIESHKMFLCVQQHAPKAQHLSKVAISVAFKDLEEVGAVSAQHPPKHASDSPLEVPYVLTPEGRRLNEALSVAEGLLEPPPEPSRRRRRPHAS